MKQSVRKATQTFAGTHLPNEIYKELLNIAEDRGTSISEMLRSAVLQALGMTPQRLLYLESLTKDACNTGLSPEVSRGAHLALVGELVAQHILTRKGAVPLADLDKISRLMMTLRGDPEKITRAQEQSQQHTIKESYADRIDRLRREAEASGAPGYNNAGILPAPSNESDDGGSGDDDDDVLDEDDDEGRGLAEAIAPSISEEIMDEDTGRYRAGRASGAERDRSGRFIVSPGKEPTAGGDKS